MMEDDQCACEDTWRTRGLCHPCRLRLLWAFSAILYGMHADASLPSAFPGRN